MCRGIVCKFHVNSHDALQIHNKEHRDVMAFYVENRVELSEMSVGFAL